MTSAAFRYLLLGSDLTIVWSDDVMLMRNSFEMDVQHKDCLHLYQYMQAALIALFHTLDGLHEACLLGLLICA